MKKQLYKAALLAALGLASVTAARADSGGDLIVGFTVGSGTDVYYNLGAASALTSGETWNVNAALTAAGLNNSLSTVQWGVLGDNVNGNTAFTSPHTAITWASTGNGVAPETLASYSAFNSLQTPINSIISSAGAFGGNLGAMGNQGTIDASSPNSWYSESLNPTLGTQWYNAFGGITANVTGLSSDALYQIVDNSSAPVDLGGFSLDNTGTLTFTAVSVPEPTTYGLIAGAGMLLVSLRNQFRRSKLA